MGDSLSKSCRRKTAAGIIGVSQIIAHPCKRCTLHHNKSTPEVPFHDGDTFQSAPAPLSLERSFHPRHAFLLKQKGSPPWERRRRNCEHTSTTRVPHHHRYLSRYPFHAKSLPVHLSHLPRCSSVSCSNALFVCFQYSVTPAL